MYLVLEMTEGNLGVVHTMCLVPGMCVAQKRGIENAQ